MKKSLPLLLILTVCGALAACSDADNHGVIINRGGLGGLFGATPVHPAPASPAPVATTEINSAPAKS